MSSLVVGEYGHRRGGEVGGVGLGAPGRFEPPPGGGVVGEGRALNQTPLLKARLLSAESDQSEGTNPAARSMAWNSHRYISITT